MTDSDYGHEEAQKDTKGSRRGEIATRSWTVDSRSECGFGILECGLVRTAGSLLDILHVSAGCEL